MERETLENLGLEVERIERDIDHCDKLGRAYSKKAFTKNYSEDNQNCEKESKEEEELEEQPEEEEEEEPEEEEEEEPESKFMIIASATNFRRAAAHSLLLGNLEQSQYFFQKAGEAYARQKLPYALMMNLFYIHLRNGNDPNRNIWTNGEGYIFRGISFEEAENLPDKLQLVYVLLCFIYMIPIDFVTYATFGIRYLSINELQTIRDKLSCYRNQPIGILGITLGSYLNVYDAIYQNLNLPNNSNLDNQISLEEALLPFLNSYNNAIRLARQNSYHWKRLAMPFHPAEPDIFSILLIVGVLMKRKKQSIFSFIESMPLQQQSKTFLNGILRSLLSERS